MDDQPRKDPEQTDRELTDPDQTDPRDAGSPTAETAQPGAPGPEEPGPDVEQDSADGARGRRFSRVTVAVLGIAVVILGLDQLTKSIAVATLDPRDPVEIIGDVVTLRLVRNSGAAFSLATGYTWVLSIIALVVVVVIIRYSSRLRSRWWALGLALVLGGAIGNLIDRIFRSPQVLQGHVVDFVSVGWWPVFNVADSAVVCGAVLLVVLSALGFDYDGTRTGWAARRDRHDAARTKGGAHA
ncbi:signal peptidase II [Gordonia sp. 'Campus']|uniref:signal peptidase II n=1 Tax=Gordonia sp. 'Campus' TaxID=2915824 RepID=UPI0035B06263